MTKVVVNLITVNGIARVELKCPVCCEPLSFLEGVKLEGCKNLHRFKPIIPVNYEEKIHGT